MGNATTSPAAEKVLDRLEGVKPLGSGWVARCPAHEDDDPSLKVDVDDVGKVLLHCHTGCTTTDVVAAMGLEMSDLFPPRSQNGSASSRRKIRETKFAGYDAETGDLIGYHVRHDFDDGSKSMWWQQPNGKNGLDKYPLKKLALYGADKIGKARAVVVTEGEKARDALWAHKIASVGTVTGAEGLPSDNALRPLLGRLVVLWPDRDDPGDKHMTGIANRLRSLGQESERIRRVVWPDSPPKGDAADFGGSVDELRALIEDAPAWSFVSSNGAHDPDEEAEADAEERQLPRFNAGRDDFAALSPLVWDALVAANSPPVMFDFHGNAIRLDRDTERVAPKPLDADRLGYELARAARWYKSVKVDGVRVELDSSPKLALVRDLLASRSFPLPPLDRIVSCPIFGTDGSLQTEPGYHAPSRTFYEGGLVLRPIPERPTEAELAEAREWIAAELLVDFPFVDNSDEAHAFGELILPFVRAMISGPCPIHVHEAPMQGTGKDLLAEVMCRVATGADPATLTYSERSEEFGKRLVSTLRPMPEWIVVPNVSGTVDNDDLADLISRGEHQGRLLGASEILRLPARNVWTLTSNNAQLTPDMVRRAVRIRIDARMERPEQRTKFRHIELKEWTNEHRSELVWSCLVIVRAWVVAGMAPGKETLGGFGQWARVVGGIVKHVGCEGFLGDRQEFTEQADSGGSAERAFVSVWWERLGPTPTGIAGLYPIAVDDEVGLDIDAPNTRGMQTKLGMRLVKMRGRRYRVSTGDIVTVGDVSSTHHGKLWKVTKEVPNEA